MLTHVKEGTSQCRYCDKKYPRSKYLKRLMQTHETEKKFQCKKCDMKFHASYDLKSHMLTQETERKFQCEFEILQISMDGPNVNWALDHFFHSLASLFRLYEEHKGGGDNGFTYLRSAVTLSYTL